MKSEKLNTNETIISIGQIPGVAMFRNNIGNFKTKRGTRIKCGVGVGGGDWIGWREIVITPEMVGQKIAVFSSIEMKSDKGKPSDLQIQWAKNVRSAGGFAGIARSIEDAKTILNLTT